MSWSSFLRTHSGTFLRGLCMGAADLVPGVSGGTIAFITGIYSRLLTALGAFSQPAFWRNLSSLQFLRLWQQTDATFLAVLAAGIITAVISLSSLLHHWLETQAHLLLAFFFGLVVASVLVVYRRWNGVRWQHYVLTLLMAALTAWLVTLPPADGGDATLPFLFLGGMVSICAMLLPGISGSYILLIIGLYPVIITALHERDWLTIIVFAAGCGMGIIFFSRLISVLLHRYQTMMIAGLLGVMMGASPKLWPWKESASGVKIILQKNVSPANFDGNPEFFLVGLLVLVGAAAILALDTLRARLTDAQ